MESQRKRVERKGRFTITEIIPGSPDSSRLSSLTIQADQVANWPSTFSGEVSRTEPQPEPLHQVRADESNERVQRALKGPIESVVREKDERMPDPSAEANVVPIETSVLIASEVAMDCMRKRSTLSDAVTAPAPESPARKFSSPKKIPNDVQRARRIKRTGRFTIIEMACDSPPSRKNADELADPRFVTTTSVKGSSVGSAPHLVLNTVERRSKPKRATRSTPRLRQTSSLRRSRKRSESPSREFVDPGGPQDAAARGHVQALPILENTDVLARVLSGTMEADTDASTASSSYVPLSRTSITFSESENTAQVSASAARPVASSSRLKAEFEANSRYRSLMRTSSLSISAAQFLQQEQTIASLIRQQNDLKQIISVLQEQQLQLMSIPSQINELKRQSASFRMKDEETRDLHVQINSLTRANESLHSLLNAAEQEVRERTIQMECLTEENDELRHRCSQFELFLHERRLED
ncbi:hypothetical protein PsorP6_001983 [Peronosclerospora sorghi]|uniref:Uncharacterized protein n=1 Tax=Peronosclerospora sorghi TaxID=230839 RepID=A0ACC0WT99_9STRA|nr:hypothetical protein PsorP6_001983 [Peronosclerospora sorghi]